VHVLQGERELAIDNKTIGRFHLDGIPPAPRGVPQIEVTFDIDANGILNVTAKDRGTGKEQRVRIEAGSGLSESEIQKMVRDAEQHAGEDKRRRTEIDARNNADALVYQTEKNLKEYGEKLSADLRADVDRAKGELTGALKGSDAEAIERARVSLEAAWQKAAASLYEKAGPSGTGGEPGEASGSARPQTDSGGGAVDAEYEVVDEK